MWALETDGISISLSVFPCICFLLLYFACFVPWKGQYRHVCSVDRYSSILDCLAHQYIEETIDVMNGIV